MKIILKVVFIILTTMVFISCEDELDISDSSKSEAQSDAMSEGASHSDPDRYALKFYSKSIKTYLKISEPTEEDQKTLALAELKSLKCQDLNISSDKDKVSEIKRIHASRVEEVLSIIGNNKEKMHSFLKRHDLLTGFEIPRFNEEEVKTFCEKLKTED
ncbi:MAG: hypothetical protein HQK54_11165 [Oligoflexales bacterium]|nr:hypothetical protein [Oligoflexales bacterium]